MGRGGNQDAESGGVSLAGSADQDQKAKPNNREDARHLY